MNLALHRSLDKLYKQCIKSHIRTCVGRLAPGHPACGRQLGAAAPARRTQTENCAPTAPSVLEELRANTKVSAVEIH